MDKKGIGLDQLKQQMTGKKGFVVPTKEPEGGGTAPKPASPPSPTPKAEEPREPSPLDKPIEISDATAQPTPQAPVEPKKEEPSGEPKPEDNKVTEPPVPKDNQDASPFAPFANVLKERGALTEQALEGLEVNTVDDLVQAMRKQIELEAAAHDQARQNTYTPQAQEFVNMYNKGVDASTAKGVVDKGQVIGSFTDESLTESDTQKQAVTMYFESLNMDSEDIKSQIQYLEDTDQLYAKSKAYADKLKKGLAAEKEALVKQAEAQKAAQQEAIQKELSDLKNKVFDVKEIVPNKPINDSLKEQLFQSMTTAVGTDPYTGQPINSVAQKRMEDPHAWEMKLHYLHLIGVFDDKWDGILNSAKTDAVKDFEKQLQTTQTKQGTQPVIHKDDTSENKTKDLLAGFNKFKQELNR